jgi:hypothetical protein
MTNITLGNPTLTNLFIPGLPAASATQTTVPLILNTATGQVFQGSLNTTVLIPFASGPVSASLTANTTAYFASAFGASSPISTQALTTSNTALTATQFSIACPAAGTLGNLQLTAAVNFTSALPSSASLSLTWNLLRGNKPGTTPTTPLTAYQTLAVGNTCTGWTVATATASGTQYIASCSDVTNQFPNHAQPPQ